ncbi:MAG: hypothetical protein IKX14_00420 [Neisseriaceae bacterium]|nr:hypothetical protein [Neisseriaceae bacterium]
MFFYRSGCLKTIHSAVAVGKNAHPTTKPTAWRWVRNPPYDCFFNNLNALLTTSNELNAMPNAATAGLA